MWLFVGGRGSLPSDDLPAHSFRRLFHSFRVACLASFLVWRGLLHATMSSIVPMSYLSRVSCAFVAQLFRTLRAHWRLSRISRLLFLLVAMLHTQSVTIAMSCSAGRGSWFAMRYAMSSSAGRVSWFAMRYAMSSSAGRGSWFAMRYAMSISAGRGSWFVMRYAMSSSAGRGSWFAMRYDRNV